jgi:hypothetical protein
VLQTDFPARLEDIYQQFSASGHGAIASGIENHIRHQV